MRETGAQGRYGPLTAPSHNIVNKASEYSRFTADTAAVGRPLVAMFALGGKGNKTRADKEKRKMLKIKIITILLIRLFSIVESQILIPDGWQKPKDKLFFQEWRKQNKLQYLSFGADLNCDGLTDSVMILESKENNGIGLFLFLRGQNEKYSQIQLYDSHKDSSNNDKDLTENQKKQIQKQFKSAYGIDSVPNGLYKTACGKGYYDCEDNEPEELLLKCSGINFFLSEGANSFYYWDTIRNKFLHVWISD